MHAILPRQRLDESFQRLISPYIIAVPDAALYLSSDNGPSRFSYIYIRSRDRCQMVTLMLLMLQSALHVRCNQNGSDPYGHCKQHSHSR